LHLESEKMDEWTRLNLVQEEMDDFKGEFNTLQEEMNKFIESARMTNVATMEKNMEKPGRRGSF
jgi:hypothetical protein